VAREFNSVNLYQLTDAQLLEVVRFSCKGEYAALWAGLLPADLTLYDFKELFKAEFAVENHDNLMGHPERFGGRICD
jgi:hypothetical protein